MSTAETIFTRSLKKNVTNMSQVPISVEKWWGVSLS
jgi:hypothetical protein